MSYCAGLSAADASGAWREPREHIEPCAGSRDEAGFDWRRSGSRGGVCVDAAAKHAVVWR